MCGIIWVLQRNGKPAVKKVRKLYHAQKTRGSQGFGYIEINKDAVGELTRTRFEPEIFATLSKSKSQQVLFHHRYPTSTINTANTAHPIPVSNKKLKYDYVVVHNGVISNASNLRARYETQGFVYTTKLTACFYSKYDRKYYESDESKTPFNDSESLAIDLALAIEGEEEALDSKGSIAFMALQIDKETKKPIKMYFGRNTSPLKMEYTGAYIKISSQGEGEDVEAHKLHSYDYANGKIITERDLKIGEKYVTYKQYTMGCKWDNALQTWVKVADEIDDEYPLDLDDEFGFSTRMIEDDHQGWGRMREVHRHAHPQKSLPAPKPVIKINPQKSTFTWIPGYINDPLKINLTKGIIEIYCLEELNEKYANIIEEQALWLDRACTAKRDRNDEKFREYTSYYREVTADEKIYAHEINRIYPRGQAMPVVTVG